MKKFLVINMLSLVLGAHLFGADPAQDVAHRNIAQRGRPQSLAANKNKKQDRHHSCSSSSSCGRDRIICCEKEERHPVYASAVANGTANMQFVAPGAPIIFNTVLNISPSSVYYNAVTGVFTVTEPGTYVIAYGARFSGSVCPTGENVCDCPGDIVFDLCASIALQVNGTEVLGSEVNNADEFLQGEVGTTDWVSIEVIQTVSAGTTIALCAANDDLHGIQLVNVGECDTCTNGDTTAFISIKKI